LIRASKAACLSGRADVAFSRSSFPGRFAALVRADASPRLRDATSGRGMTFHALTFFRWYTLPDRP
jgi:hypothetical protein